MFMFKAFKESLVERKGRNPLLIWLLFQVVNLFLLLPVVGVVVFLVNLGVAFGNGLLPTVLMIGVALFVFFIGVPLQSFLTAALVGELKEVVMGGTPNAFKGFFKKGATYFWRVFGCVALALPMAVALTVLLYVIVGTAWDMGLSSMLPFFLTDAILVPFFLFSWGLFQPFIYLSVFEGGAWANYRAFLKEKKKPFLLVLLGFLLLRSIPVFGVLIGLVAIFFPLYVLVLHADTTQVKATKEAAASDEEIESDGQDESGSRKE